MRLRKAIRWTAFCALVPILLGSGGCARPCGLFHAAGVVKCGACGDCGLIRGRPCRSCALGHKLHCKIKRLKRPVEEPQLPPEDMPDFPKFHPVPLQPAFSRRDALGFPDYHSAGGPAFDAIPTLESIPLEDGTMPFPQARAKPKGRRTAATPSSWVFTQQKPAPTGVLPPRNNRPTFAEEKPRAANVAR